MKQLFCVVIALVIAVSFAACTSEGDDTTTIATTTVSMQTTTSTQGTVTTTIDNTVNTTTQQDQTTTEQSDVTNTTTDVVTTTATAPTTDSSDEIAYYSQYPEVPDYGAMVGVNYTKFKNGTFYYDATLVAQADPQNESASEYMQLLQDCGYIALSPYDKNGVQGYVYGNSDTGIVVLFGAAREQGAIVVAISQQ